MVRLVSCKSALNFDIGADTYVCIYCNLDNEAKKPWLLQRVADPPPPNGPHHVFHTLALAVDSSKTELTIEDRLNRLEEKFEQQVAAFRELHNRFESHEKVMQECMQEMSHLMHQVLAATVQNG